MSQKGETESNHALRVITDLKTAGWVKYFGN